MKGLLKVYNSLSFRLIFWVGLILLISIVIWAYFNIKYQEKRAIENMVAEADRLGKTIKLGAHYAMMLNSRDDITEIIKNIGQQKEIENIRIYNKEGEIKFSNDSRELDQTTNIKDEACYICHRSDPPTVTVSLEKRTRIFDSSRGHRFMGIISPIYNELNCSAAPCHVHPGDKKVLGLLDAVISLEETDKEILTYEKGIIGLAVFLFLGTSAIIGLFLLRFVNRPIRKLIKGTHQIGHGNYDYRLDFQRDDEIGQLSQAIHEMGKEIGEKQDELNKQRNEYQDLFERAPCYITVQDRDFKLLRYNREFAERFDPQRGDYCYQAYKNRSEKCELCPVVETFKDGQPHFSDEMGISKDGSPSYWLVRTSPIKNSEGEVVAAMEMCLDVTHTKILEKEVEKSEAKYRTIFNTIPNPVFVVDAKSLNILDCNNSVSAVYGFSKEALLETPFADLFEESARAHYSSEMITSNALNQVRQLRKDGNIIYVNIRISSSEYMGREVLLITTSDITMRLMAEQQLIQAGKMATLGEMATGVAHELNQPLSVIKTASTFLNRKVREKEKIKDDILETLAAEIDSHVDRADKIIKHMREFGRKSDVKKEKVEVNASLSRALEIFSQQLKLREIHVVKDLDDNLPLILADANRLEQVFINLLINARDAIEERWEKGERKGGKEKQIFLKSRAEEGKVKIEIEDTGTGIPKSVLDRIFEPFFTTKTVGQGTGLGLSISYGIIKDYYGTIKVETGVNKGSKFIIHFPALEED
ncbi:MAG: PAS domain S-box protein [Deltaproteobacteria bacterium]|nr:PAS domain S-box protein [Deltaproteobacteria bacterium]